ncbi:MAG: hypothetical protein DRI56_11345 [Chloroflexota bacterium]|nr:MAG: hypothetical protein DRI56_11345 [Chloroflexota bacterium]
MVFSWRGRLWDWWARGWGGMRPDLGVDHSLWFSLFTGGDAFGGDFTPPAQHSPQAIYGKRTKLP